MDSFINLHSFNSKIVLKIRKSCSFKHVLKKFCRKFLCRRQDSNLIQITPSVGKSRGNPIGCSIAEQSSENFRLYTANRTASDFRRMAVTGQKFGSRLSTRNFDKIFQQHCLNEQIRIFQYILLLKTM